MGKKISYSDGLFLAACRNLIGAESLTKETRSKLAAQLRHKSEKIRCKANGVWKLPEGRAEFAVMLERIAEMLSLGTDAQVICDTIKDCMDLIHMVERRCKVVFLVQEKSIWPSLESVYLAMKADDRFDPKLVHVPFQHISKVHNDEVAAYRESGFKVIPCAEYDLSQDNPDVVFFAKPYDGIPNQFYITEVEKIIERTVYVPYGLELNYHLIRYGFGCYLHYRVWRHIAYGEVVREVGTQSGYRNGENIVVWGHPKADHYRPEKQYTIPGEWKRKAAGRKVLLWCPHHTIVPGPECVSTYLELSEAVFREAERRSKELVLLWRPHPMLFGALVNNGHMTQEGMDDFLAEKTAQGHIILDAESDYRIAFAMSDALISDGTTFSIEYLLTGKPLMLTAQSMEPFYHGDELEQALYIGKGTEDIAAFMDRLIMGEDPKQKLRDALSRQWFFRPEGKTVGQNIADHILEDIQSESTIVI